MNRREFLISSVLAIGGTGLLSACEEQSKSYPALKKGANMKVLMINGSPRKDGNTSIALKDTDYGLTWKYADFGRVDGKTFPQHMHVTAGKGEVQNLSVDMKLSRLSASDGWDAQTELSSKYQEVELTELLQLLLKS